MIQHSYTCCGDVLADLQFALREHFGYGLGWWEGVLLCIITNILRLSSVACGTVFLRGPRALDTSNQNITDFLSSIPSDETTLDLSRNSLTILHLNLFVSLTHLTTLILDENKISTIEPGAFNGTYRLQHLYLSLNMLDTIQACVFLPHTDLIELKLDQNEITTIEQRAFEGLSNLQYLTLYKNSLDTVGSSDFSNLTNLKVLELHSNQISELHEDSFKALFNLESLLLQHNKLEYIRSEHFSALTNLELLQLEGNLITTLENGSFHNLVKLEQLYLHHNKLNFIDPSTFSSLSDLVFLWLEDNVIETLEQGIFDRLVKLQDLSISWNKLKTIPSTCLSGLTNLKKLWLHENVITTLENGSFHNLFKLKELHLYHNVLESLRENMFISLNYLTILTLYRNRIDTIDNGTFNGLFRLRHLILHTNRLIAIPDLSDTHALSVLNLDLNPIQTISSKNIKQMRNVTGLYFLGARVNHLPPFSNLQKLRRIRLDDMGSNHPPHHVLDGINTLTFIKLAQNKMAYFPNIGGSKNILTELYLHHNRIYHIPSLKPYKRLAVLELSHNYITMVQEDHLSHMGPGHVNLYWNHIPCLRQMCWLRRRSLRVTVRPTCVEGNWEKLDTLYICEGWWNAQIVQ